MQNRKLIYSLIIFLLAISIIMGVIILYDLRFQNLKIIFFDVGQGDAILISQGRNQILIDGGKDGQLILEKLGKAIPFWDRQIEIMIATHPDQDHIGGLVSVLKAYDVQTVLNSAAQSDSQTYQAFREGISNEGAEEFHPARETKIKLPNDVEVEILYPFPDRNSFSDSNAGSIVAQLKFGENKFLFTGDLPSEQENELINTGANMDIDILKVAHHGSKYSTSEEFLNAASPEEAVISVGNNSYGHPAREVLDRLMKHGVKIFRTDEMGDIIYKCNPPTGGQSSECKMEFN